MPKTKECTSCKENLPLIQFKTTGISKVTQEDLKASMCIGCEKEYKRQWHLKNREKNNKKSKERYENNKEIILEYCKKYQEEHKEEIQARQREYYLKNKDKLAAQNKENYEKSKEEYNKNRREKYANDPEYKRKCQENNKKGGKAFNERRRERRKTDINFKLSTALRDRINCAIKNNQKAGSAIKDLGCNIEELKKYLESKFYPNQETGETMAWKNHGYYGWHIDHIIPLASFNLENREEFLKACHYTNLQPLWAKENFKKSDSVGEE